MKDYTVTITLTIPITARNDEEAHKRGASLELWVKIEPRAKTQWFGDITSNVTVEET